MADSKAGKGLLDLIHINVDVVYEVDYWSVEFGVSEDELRKAIAEAWPMAGDVKRWLKKNKLPGKDGRAGD